MSEKPRKSFLEQQTKFQKSTFGNILTASVKRHACGIDFFPLAGTSYNQPDDKYQ